jgi:hypothetical protein
MEMCKYVRTEDSRMSRMAQTSLGSLTEFCAVSCVLWVKIGFFV